MDPDLHLKNGTKLRYGENPHQEGWFFETDDGTDDPLAIQKFTFLQGKELSYNNYLDMDGALFALSHMGGTEAGCVIVKHTNPCGAALRASVEEAYQSAWYEGDPLAAFGGIMAVNREVDAPLAEKMIQNFFEILMAPSVTDAAKAVFEKKPNIRIMVNPALHNPSPSRAMHMHKVRGGMLVESADSEPLTAGRLTTASSRAATAEETEDLLFAWAICRSSKSNTVVAVKHKTLIASGVGQQDRKRCAELCVAKAGERMKGAVAASDAFFPFRDATDVLITGGVTAIIQPGGSVNDQQSIDAANESHVAMVLTGSRAFRH
jgi:phosphoribosylaminoimidazolecarboxamide formyltransferase/IMP cyclohydrolase